ncbi:speckle-type POZ protein-like A [Caerostris extrusa]|uniref:Speckle-type POZ protein-like A n=1 Tax=Caerostris extrusa TaxID=172846 RepID=A0AAV4WII2_CAEEX|nr:speckle-type POZ protein-like A [Caerostris extrusa]
MRVNFSRKSQINCVKTRRFPRLTQEDKMTEFPIDWDLQSTNIAHPWRTGYVVSNLTLNNEWTMAALWCNNQTKNQLNIYANNRLESPKYVEICRKSTTGEVLVSGTLKLTATAHLMLKEVVVFERKIYQLAEIGLNYILIELFHTKNQYNYHSYKLTGNIKIHRSKQIIGKCDCENQIQSKSLTELSKNFECLLDTNVSYFSDVSLVCGSVAIPAHKNVLCARSPVFAAMFTAQMKENTENKVHITDMEVHILRAMVVHIYTGKTEYLNVASAGGLLFAADKYHLGDLKRVCCNFLKENMTLENVLNTLVLGHLHNKDLKACAMKFICEFCANISAIEETREWKLLRKERPQLAIDVLTALVKSKEKKLKR